MLFGKLESSAHWVAELVCAGHFSILWDIILHYLAKYINIGNPKLPIYILMRVDDFRTIVRKRNYITELDLRNNEQIRNIFIEIIITLSLSIKKPAFEPVIQLKNTPFNVSELHSMLNAPAQQIDKIAHILKDEDPHELFPIMTEFCFCLYDRKCDQSGACFWIDWVIQYQIHYMKTKKESAIVCARRTNIPVEVKYQTNLIWIMWDILIDCAAIINPLLHKIIRALMNLFCLQFKLTVCKHRIQLLFFAVSLITEKIDFSVEIISTANKSKLENILEINDRFYRELKKNEESPNVDYMFMGMKDQRAYNLKMGVAKMELLANLENR
jgi:hypothetical protein